MSNYCARCQTRLVNEVAGKMLEEVAKDGVPSADPLLETSRLLRQGELTGPEAEKLGFIALEYGLTRRRLAEIEARRTGYKSDEPKSSEPESTP